LHYFDGRLDRSLKVDEQRQQAYLELVQALLQCEVGTETDILQAHPKLVDEGLVMTLLAVAQMMSQENNPESTSTVAWLTDFASQLAQSLGMDTESISESESQLDFLMTVFQAIAESSGNYQVIYPLFHANLSLLDESLIPLLTTWHQSKFTEVDEDGKQFLAAVVAEFANLIQQFPLGSRMANLEIAIACYQLILQVYNRDAYPEQWAATQMNLAVAYSDRIRGDRADNIELAIAYDLSVLEVRSREVYPEGWAMAQMNLANFYSSRIRGERAANLEESIACYQLALEVYTREAYPEQWAITQMNLAVAYSNRIRGERTDNLELAIYRYNLALVVYTREAYPEDWARTQMNLAVAYSDRIRGERAANLEESIASYQLALEIRSRESYPERWATTQMNLAVAYRNRIRGERAANLEESIDRYRLALEVYTREAYPQDWAMTQMNLAVTYSDRIWGERAANLEESIERYKLALEVYAREAYPECWARTQMNLAILYAEEGENDLAIHHYQQALEVFQPESFPIEALTADRGLGNIYFKQGNWQLAIDSYELAIQAVEISRSWATSDESRQRIIHEAILVYESVIQSCINIGEIDRAIEYSERARSRQIVDLIFTNDLYTNSKATADIKVYLAEYESLTHEIKSHATSSKSSFNTRERSIQVDIDLLSDLEVQKQNIWKEIRRLDPIIAGQVRVDPIDFATIQTLIPNSHTAILSFYTTDDDTHIFIITRDRQPQIHNCQGQGWENFQQWLQARWLIPYFGDRDRWISTFPAVLKEIAQRIQLDNLVDKLTDISELIIIPHLLLHQIPFAALPLSLEGENELLSDRFIIHYAPSCQILKYCHDRRPSGEVRYGIIEDTEGTLPGTVYECQEVAGIFHVDERYYLKGRQQGTVERFNALLSGNPLAPVTSLHIAHHAYSRPDQPLESALVLVDGEIALGRLIMNRYPLLDEVFLSCCETAIGAITITDDILTLATGFLCAGARSVIGTLWAVNDLSTALFSIFYYCNRRDGYSRSQSLRMAQVRLRNLSCEEFDLSYRGDLKKVLTAYAKTNKVNRNELEKQLECDEISKSTYESEYVRLTHAYYETCALIDSLDRYSQADRPFAHPYYWAAFICQGLG
jgi:CHAT domain-containing protein/tetratricopeptide (TPR) repeat protein